MAGPARLWFDRAWRAIIPQVIVVGDIGGTKTLVALFEAGKVRFERRYASHDFASFDDLLRTALDDAGAGGGDAHPGLEHACFAVAGPVVDEHVDVTNLPWVLEASGLARRFSIDRVQLVNDFAASARGIDVLEPRDLATLQAGTPVAGAPRVLIGAGTGLGVAYLIADASGPRVVASEGGHAGFAPATAAQAALSESLRERHGRVEAEHVVSGPGLARIYAHLRSMRPERADAELDRAMADGDAAAAIAHQALERADTLAAAALDLFIASYGTVAGDHALNVIARGGVYVAGGIAPKILQRLAAGGFVAAFTAKGEFSALARSIPVHVVLNERLALLGAARIAGAL